MMNALGKQAWAWVEGAEIRISCSLGCIITVKQAQELKEDLEVAIKMSQQPKEDLEFEAWWSSLQTVAGNLNQRVLHGSDSVSISRAKAKTIWDAAKGTPK